MLTHPTLQSLKTMKLELYNMLSRRTVLKGAAAASALAATGSVGMPPVR